LSESDNIFGLSHTNAGILHRGPELLRPPLALLHSYHCSGAPG